MAGAAKKRAAKDRKAGHNGRDNTETGVTLTEPSPSQPALQVDGPGDPHGPGSTSGLPVRERQTSNAPPPSQASTSVKPILRDPARDMSIALNRNVDFPGNVYNIFSEYDMPTELMKRPEEFNNTGKGVQLAINSYPMLSPPTVNVFQYDVNIGSGAEKRGLIQAVWHSKTLQDIIKRYNGECWIFDGNKIAWATSKISQDLQFSVDLDEERGRTGGRDNKHRVQIRQTSVVNLAAVGAYVKGQMSFDNSVLEGINFLDHLLRETPSKNHISVKRSFFARSNGGRKVIGGGVEALKGVYQSIRAVQGGRLVVNVDVSNSCFWHACAISSNALQMSGAESMIDLCHRIAPVQQRAGGPFRDTPQFQSLKRLKKNKFTVTHRYATPEQKEKQYIIKDVSHQTARNYKFGIKDKVTKEVVKESTVYEYFIEVYNLRLQWPDLPLLVTPKGEHFPMECCLMVPGQRYPYKLSEKQTSEMIKFAVTKPAQRLETIQQGLTMLDWPADPKLKTYGMRIDVNMLKTSARVLNPPEVVFANGSAKPGYSGRWDLKGKKFLNMNKDTLTSWGVCVFKGARQSRDDVSLEEVKHFISTFLTIYKSHGGIVDRVAAEPLITFQVDAGAGVNECFMQTGNKFQKRPQMMLFILNGRDAFHYLRVKKSSDCRFGVMSQCCQSVHVKKCAAQYISNVLMKFNAKMGGTTARASPKTKPWGQLAEGTLIIGADVSHASPGSLQASMAAVTVSMDKIAARYAAACQTNGHRVEMITTNNLGEMLRPLLREWSMHVGSGRLPNHVFYFRDGVSEGQYQHVLQHEVKDIKALFSVVNPQWPIKYTVVVASKRHHIRFFPQANTPASDKNCNPVPGTLVEKDVTHPFEYDFYLNSHSAIQGTARPTHYHVLMDDAKMKPHELQNMIYEHCYQYMRSTTPVSLFPAVYYAHLASNRARSHEDIPASAGPHLSDEILKAQKSTTSSEKPPTEEKPLLVMDEINRIPYGMWYI